MDQQSRRGAAKNWLLNFPGTIIQCYDDAGTKRPAISIGQFDPNLWDAQWSRIVDANAKRFGVFFTVNAFSGNSKSIENLVGWNAAFVDLDTKAGSTKQEMMDRLMIAPMVPSFVVESGGGYHPYWLLMHDKPRLAKVPFEELTKFRLVPYFNGDPAAVNPGRVLRLPFTYHHKAEPFLVRIVWAGDGAPVRYDPGEILERFPRVTDADPISSGGFNIDKFCAEAGLRILYRIQKPDGRMFHYLKDCPWGDSHSEKQGRSDTSLIYYMSGNQAGKTAFKCFHGHCVKRGWKDVKEKYVDCPELAKRKKTTKAEKKHFDPEDILEQMEPDRYFYREELGFYKYFDGVWKPWQNTAVMGDMDPFMERPKLVHHYQGVLNQLRIKTNLPDIEMINSKHRYINVLNGMYDYQNDCLLPHDPKLYKTTMAPLVYDPKAECPIWDKTIAEIIQDKNCCMKLQEFMGLCFTTITKFQVAAIFAGHGKNGKSTVIDILEYLVGEENCSQVSFHDLKDKFCRIMMLHKTLNISSETGIGRKVETSYFKQIVGGDTIMGANKGKPEVKFKPYCKILFATNELPQSYDNTFGFTRRLLIFPFTQTFEDEGEPDSWNIADKDLGKKLKGEAAGIFNWMMRGLRRLIGQNYFTPDLLTKKESDTYKRENNHIVLFFEDQMKLEDGGEVLVTDCYMYYKWFCRINGHKNWVSSNWFTKYLKRDVDSSLELGRTKSVERKRCIKGCTYADYSFASEKIEEERKRIDRGMEDFY